MDQKNVKIFPDIYEISYFLLKEWETCQNNALNDKKIFSVALSGGNTPIPFYQAISKQKNKFIWDKTYIFFVDERYVPFSHKDNNFKMIKENFLNKINIPEKNIFPINTGLPLNKTVIDYEKQIKNFFNYKLYPSFDLILLGIGNDGHTASLFPENRVLNEKKMIVSAVEDRSTIHKRITLTYPVLNNSKKIIFLVTGKNKSQIIKEIIIDKDNSYPASRIKLKNGTILFLLDKQAGEKLNNFSKF